MSRCPAKEEGCLGKDSYAERELYQPMGLIEQQANQLDISGVWMEVEDVHSDFLLSESISFKKYESTEEQRPGVGPFARSPAGP